MSAKKELMHWENGLIDDLCEMIKTSTKEWAVIINKFGMASKEKNAWINSFKSDINNSLNKIIKEAQEKQEACVTGITNLTNMITDLSKQLRIKVPTHNSKTGYYEEEKCLQDILKRLQVKVDEKLREIRLLKLREKEVCNALYETPTSISESPLPTDEDVANYKRTIEILEIEKLEREEKFLKLKCEIVDKCNEMIVKPSNDFENLVLTGSVSSFSLSSNNMIKLEMFHDHVEKIYKDSMKEGNKLREQLKFLWDIVGDNPKGYEEFLKKHPGHSSNTLQTLKLEICRLETIKRTNIEIFIKKLREELTSYWDKCGIHLEERNSFDYFNDTYYTEELLTVHDLELEKYKNYYNDNIIIFEMIDTREDLWKKYMSLEEKSTTNDRFKNRGGQLLKEEKERNLLTRKLKRIEDKIVEYAEKYEEENGSKFTYWGQNIIDLIRLNNEKLEFDRKMTSKRKLVPESIPTTRIVLNKCSSISSLRAQTINSSQISTAATSCDSSLKFVANSTLIRQYQRQKPLFKSSPIICYEKQIIKQKYKTNPSKANVPSTKFLNHTISKHSFGYTKDKKKLAEKLKRISGLIKDTNNKLDVNILNKNDNTCAENNQEEIKEEGDCVKELPKIKLTPEYPILPVCIQTDMKLSSDKFAINFDKNAQ